VTELVSVVIPVRNGARYIAEAIQSALDQPNADIEVIVIDDGSTDDSARIADAFGKNVRVLRQDPLGSGPARNEGVLASSGALLSFLDADDRFTRIKTAAQLKVLAADPSLDAVFGHARQFISPDTPEQVTAVRVPREIAAVETPTTMLIRREAFDRVGPYAAIPVAVTVDWMLRAREAGLRSTMLDEVVYERRIHEHNTGIERRAEASERLRVLKASLDRRRARPDA
jgi:glycosyltransferase involved in cell wall biosynthesis